MVHYHISNGVKGFVNLMLGEDAEQCRAAAMQVVSRSKGHLPSDLDLVRISWNGNDLTWDCLFAIDQQKAVVFFYRHDEEFENVPCRHLHMLNYNF